MAVDLDQFTSSHAIAGVAGSLVSLKFAPGLTWPERAFNFVSGSLCAILVAPALTEFFKLTSPAMLSGVSFAVGLFGLSLAAAASDALRKVKWAEVVQGLIGRKD